MIDHREWVTKLRNDCAVLGGRVYDIAQYVRESGAWNNTPIAYVYPVADSAGENYSSMHARQVVTGIIGVLMVIRATGTTEHAFNTLVTVRNAVNSTLQGWTPTGCMSVALFTGGQAEAIVDSDIVWEDRYKTEYMLNL